MNDAIYTEVYKGHTIEIFHDCDSDSPDDWGDDGAFLVCEDRDMTVKREGFDVETVYRALNDAKDEDGEIDEEAEKIAKEYYIFPIEAYINGGIVLHFENGSKVDRRWDVSTGFGFILVRNDEVKTEKVAKHIASGTLELWNDALSGNVFGYSIDGGYGDSCCGFYGDYEKNALVAGREAVDSISPEDWEKEKTREKIDALRLWETTLTSEEREKVKRSIISIEKTLEKILAK
jgi:hypothetical protein